jgi:hypothetical protein
LVHQSQADFVALMAADVSPEGAAVHPAKGEALVWLFVPGKRPAQRAEHSSAIPRAPFDFLGMMT